MRALPHSSISLRSMRMGYQYEVRRRWAWGCRLCRPQRKLRQPLLCPFAVFAPRSVERRGQRRFRLIYAAKRRRTTALRFIDQLSQFAQPAKGARLPLVYGRSFSVRFRGAKPPRDNVSQGGTGCEKNNGRSDFSLRPLASRA